MIALSLLRRNPVTHGVSLDSPSSFVLFKKKNELQSGKEKRTSDCSSSFIQLLSYSIDMLIAITAAALCDVRTVFAIHVVYWILLLPDWLNFVSPLVRDQ